jgi:hypothetical protein
VLEGHRNFPLGGTSIRYWLYTPRNRRFHVWKHQYLHRKSSVYLCSSVSLDPSRTDLLKFADISSSPIYELANYFILSRILYYVPYHSPIHPGRVLTTFGFISTIIEALNGNGAAYVANTSLPQKKQEIGHSLLKSALILQLVVLSLFVVLAITFHRRCLKAGLVPNNLVQPLRTLYISSTLIGIRTTFRTVEYFTASSLNFHGEIDPNSLSPLLRYEWFFWVFEGSLMMINTFLLNFSHPMRYLPRNNKVYLALDGVTEVEGPGYDDKRHWLVTVVDPFDLASALRGKKLEERFWETHHEGRVTTVKPHGDAEAGNVEAINVKQGKAGD